MVFDALHVATKSICVLTKGRPDTTSADSHSKQVSMSAFYVSGAGPSQRHGIAHDSFADEGLTQPAKKKKVSEEGFTSKKVRVQDFYVKVSRSQVQMRLLECTGEVSPIVDLFLRSAS